MTEIKYIKFEPSPDFHGMPLFAKPLFFGLHPNYASGEQWKWVITLDYQAVKKQEATGEISPQQTEEILSDLSVEADSKRALNFY